VCEQGGAGVATARPYLLYSSRDGRWSRLSHDQGALELGRRAWTLLRDKALEAKVRRNCEHAGMYAYVHIAACTCAYVWMWVCVGVGVSPHSHARGVEAGGSQWGGVEVVLLAVQMKGCYCWLLLLAAVVGCWLLLAVQV